jgi:hypothetical protein
VGLVHAWVSSGRHIAFVPLIPASFALPRASLCSSTRGRSSNLHPWGMGGQGASKPNL